jgi:hypothetical protein
MPAVTQWWIWLSGCVCVWGGGGVGPKPANPTGRFWLWAVRARRVGGPRGSTRHLFSHLSLRARCGQRHQNRPAESMATGSRLVCSLPSATTKGPVTGNGSVVRPQPPRLWTSRVRRATSVRSARDVTRAGWEACHHAGPPETPGDAIVNEKKRKEKERAEVG